MAFPPEFLEELRRRLPLSGVVGRRVRLAKKGREFTGLCPFHNEKSPSFFVNDDKGFFHCFGCGAHGDAVEFVMRVEAVAFPEAVERLAGEAGLEVPRSAPADPRAMERRKTIELACEAACSLFQAELRKPGGRAALDYLRGRGVTEAELDGFRLGFAPDGRIALKSALLKQGFEEGMLVEAGLLIRPEEGGKDTYDRFRGRVMFPIADRQGRIVAFGGRIMGDGQPKYLNSPETPLFHKGRMLFAHHRARAAVPKGAEVLVVEGYMDVIALHRAGFGGAVAPLGTALTEEQLAELWRMAPEPVLCFDGDAAGMRAALRAAERALPLLEPGRSLRFITIPGGQDPDDLVRRPGGAQQMRELITAARPLAEIVWQTELELRPCDTPERRADLRQRLRERAQSIVDRDVRGFYSQEFAEREAKLFGTVAPAQQGRQQGWGSQGRGPGRGQMRPRGKGGRWPEPDPYLKPAPGRETREHFETGELKALLATLVNHPGLLDEVHESLADLELPDPELDSIRRHLVNLSAAWPGLDVAALQTYLADDGYGLVLAQLLHRDVYAARPFARPTATIDVARLAVRHLMERLAQPRIAEDQQAAARVVVEEVTAEAWARFSAMRQSTLPEQRESDVDGQDMGGTSGAGSSGRG